HGTLAKRIEEFPAQDVFLGTQVIPAKDGTVVVPVADNGLACIGLEWHERRLIRSFAIQFADPSQIPPAEKVQIQYWKGESVWQGIWESLKADIETKQDWLSFRLGRLIAPRGTSGTEKIRCVFPAGQKSVMLKSLSAHTPSLLDAVNLRVELERPLSGQTGRIEVYNGTITSPSDAGLPLQCNWDLSASLDLKIHYCKTRPWKTDRTVLRFRLPDAAFGVAVEDVLANKCVFVPHAGLFVADASSDITLSDYRKKIENQKTVLQRVREMPDQTFEQAWEKVHNPIQDLGPMLISLACDNRKFVAHREGTITFAVYDAPDKNYPKPKAFPCKLQPQFGFKKSQQITRHLYGGWLPVPVLTLNEDGVMYHQRTFVAPCDDKPLPESAGWLHKRAMCVAEYMVRNTLPRDAPVSLTLTLLSDVKSNQLAELQQVDKGVIAAKDGRLLMFADTANTDPLEVRIQAGTLSITGTLLSKHSIRCYVYLPAWQIEPNDYAHLAGGLKWLQSTEDYWKRVMAPAIQIKLPDSFLTNAIKASQVHCLLAARNEKRAARVEAWIASDRYGPLESESHAVIRGMDMMGHRDFARRSLKYFVKQYNPAGYLTTGYTLMGSGWHLWTLAEHYERTRDKDWLGKVAPKVVRLCQWIARQCEKTKRLDARGEKVPEFGLVPPGVAADWNRYAYRFVLEAHHCAGLQQAARALEDIQHPDASSLLGKAAEFRENIVRAYRWTQSRSPVLPLADGSWIPAYPGMLYCLGRIEDIIPGEDGNRSWCYDVELGAHHLAALGILAPEASEVSWINDHMEDVWFLHAGMGDYPADKSEEDFYNLGGFSKVQPYYCRIAEIYALRDEVKPFIRSYFNTIGSLLSKENLSFWEHFHNIAAWNKTHETGYFLAQSRIMLVAERGDELWLVPFVTGNWLKDGMKISVSKAPTRFGEISYIITSSVDRGFIEAVINPPKRSVPGELVMRLRHPEAKPIKSVTVNDQTHQDFDTVKECIRIKPVAGTITVRAYY
ncbi:MAG: hypothetical protein JSV03_15685, partial [Planctomycetota bacterium]